MSWRLALMLAGVALLLLLALPALAAGPGGTGIEDAMPLTGIQSGTLTPFTSYWFKIKDPSPRQPSPPSLLMNYTPTKVEERTHITFKVYKFDNRLFGQAGMGWPYSLIGEGTQGSLPVGLKYWKASNDPGQTYYIQVVNDTSDSVDFGIVMRGDLPDNGVFSKPAIVPGFPPRDVSPGAAQATPTPASNALLPDTTISASPTVTPSVQAGVNPPRSAVYTDTTYVISETRQIGAYTVRFWRGIGAGVTTFVSNNIVTITGAPGTPVEQIENVYAINELSGKDITGSGNLALILETFTGGAHCCFATVVYELGPQPNKVMDLKPSNCSGKFADLDNDSKYEYVTCDDVFAYQYCAYAYSPVARVIMKYVPGRGYVVANLQYPAQYEPDIEAHTKMAEDAANRSRGEWDDNTKCAVLPLVLDYLYSGRTEEAWAALYKYYPDPDVEQFKAEIQAAVSASSLYQAP